MISYKEYSRAIKLSEINGTPLSKDYLEIKNIIDICVNNLTKFEIMGELGFVYYKNKTNVIFKVETSSNTIYGNVNDLWLKLFLKSKINNHEVTELLENEITKALPYKDFKLKTDELDDKSSEHSVHINERKIN